MKEITVAAPSGAYPVKIGRGLLESAAREIRQVCPGEKMALVTDETVAPLYAASLQKQLEVLGYRVFLITVPPGEGSKSLSALEGLYDALARAGFTRSDAVLALGGGVVGDLAGFAAATMGQESIAEAITSPQWYNPFPRVRYTERPDTAAASILEGNIILMVDNTPAAMKRKERSFFSRAER